MANERTYPCLPCADIEGSIAFYESLGFTRTYRQVRPNPYAVVAREDLQIHLFGIDGAHTRCGGFVGFGGFGVFDGLG
jgi:catechol 2,3-dioxygenase-like lactoylglutathione lyase family enzyme